MATTSKNQKNQLIVLIVLVIIMLCFLGYQFKSYLNIPTKSRIEKLSKTLQDAKDKLKVAQIEKEKYNQEISELRDLSAPFWDASNQRAIEQDVRLRFESIARDARITWKTLNTQKSKSTAHTNIQEIEIRMEFESFTMQDLCLLFEKMEDFTKRNQRRFHWSSFRLSTAPTRIVRAPGMPPGGPAPQQNPNARTLKLTAIAKAYALSPEASEFIFSNGATALSENKGVAKP